MPLIRIAWVSCIFTVLGQPLYAQEAALKDVNGDPLPLGAFARLGSMQFRVAGPVYGARFLDGGKKLLVRVQKVPARNGIIESQGTFVLFDFDTGKELGRIPCELNAILGYERRAGPISDGIVFSNWCLSPDATMIANLEDWPPFKLQVRELATGKVVFEVNEDKQEFKHVQFSPDGKCVAAVAVRNDETTQTDKKPIVAIRLWNLRNRKEIRTFIGPQLPKESFQAHWFAFSPNGAYLAATGYEQGKAGVVRVWDVAGKSSAWKLEGETEKRDEARPIAFSPDGKSLAAVYNGKIRLWNPATGKRVKDVAPFAGRCATLDFSPDGKRLIAGTGNKAANTNVVRMWDLISGREVPLPTAGSLGYIFSESGDVLVLADPSEQSLVICDSGTGRIQQTIHLEIPRAKGEYLERMFYNGRQGMGWPFALSPDGKTLVVCDRPGQLRRFEVATGKEIPSPGLVTDPACSLAFAPDGKKLLAAGRGRVFLYDVKGKTLPIQLLPKIAPSTNGLNVKDKPNPICLALSSDGRRAAAGWDDGLVDVWETDTGKLLWQAHDHEGGILSLVFALDDQTLISTGMADGRVIWWNVATGQRQRALALESDRDIFARGSLVLGPSALTAFLYNWGQESLECELASGKVRRKIKNAGSPVAFSVDGRFLLNAGPGAFHLIDLVSGDIRRSFAWADKENAGSGSPACARFSPNGRTIAGIAGNEVVRVWDRDTATLLATLSGHDGGPLAVAFAPDGLSIATSAGDGTILLWRTPPSPVPPTKEQAPPAPKVPTGGTASEGGPLPASAKKRLGLLRFQGGVDVSGLRYTADGKSILVLTKAPQANRWVQVDLALWDAATGNLQSQMEVTNEASRVGGWGGGGPLIDDWSVSPDGKLLAISNSYARSSIFRPLCVKEIATGKTVYQAKDIEDQVALALFTPNSKSLVDLSTLTLIDLATGRPRKMERAERNNSVRHAQFSPDGKVLLVDNGDGTVFCWHLDRGGPGVRLHQRLLAIDPLVIAPDSKQLAISVLDDKDSKPRLVLVDIESGKTIRDFGKQDDLFVRPLFSPDGKQLVAVSRAAPRREIKDGKDVWIFGEILRRWEMTTGKELSPIATTNGLVAQFTPDGQAIAIASGRFLRLHDAASGRELRRFPLQSKLDDVLQQTLNLPHAIGDPFAFSPDGKTVAVAARRTIRQFDVKTGKEIGPRPISQTVFGLAVARDAQWIASWSLEEVLVWDTRGNKVVLRVEPWSGADKKDVCLSAAALSSDGSRLAVGGSDGDIALFEVPSGKCLRQFHFHTAPVTSLVLLADNGKLVSSDKDGQVAYWDVATGALLRKIALPRHSSKTTSSMLSEEPNGRILVTNSEVPWGGDWWWDLPTLTSDARMLLGPQGRAIQLWELGGLDAGLIESPNRYGGKLAISQDQRMLAVQDGWPRQNPQIRLMDVARRKELRAVDSSFPITDFCFSPDGRLLAACGNKGLTIWDTATGTVQAEFNGHRGVVTTVAFSPDGGTLVSAAYDGTLLLWDVATLLARRESKDLTANNFKAFWEDLASPDAGKADTALRQLVAHPQRTAALLGERLKAVTASEKEIARLVGDLDSAQPKTRAIATKELQELGEIAEPALRSCLAATPTPEQRARVLQLLARVSEPIADVDKLRELRAVEVLELVGSPEAALVLRTLAGGVESSYVTQQAAGALGRMHRQPVPYPPESTLR